MQKEANSNEIAELCFIYNERNKLNAERNTARHKRNYLLGVRRAWIVRFKFEKSECFKKIKTLPGIDASTIEAIKRSYLKSNPLPVKYQKMQISDINLMILELEKTVSDMKFMIAIHTKNTRRRVLNLIKNTGCHPKYIDGDVKWIDQWTLDHKDDKGYCVQGKFIKRMSKQYVEVLAHQFELNNEIHKLLGD
jgi:hypothetical protein